MSRILVIANETVESELLAHAIRAKEASQVLIVAPALNGRVRHWTSDDDDAHAAADERLRRSLDRLAASGIPANGMVGDADPLQAAADALRVFPAEELVVATHPEGRSNWLARGVVERARRRFGLPVMHLVVDRDARREYLAAAA
jgi:GABA permease